MFAFVAAILLCAAPIAWTGDSKEDLKLMEGEWVAKSAQLAGMTFPDEILPIIKLAIKGDEYNLNFGGKIDKGKIKLEGAKSPKEMNIIGGEDGPNKGKTFLVIYEVTDDDLKICYDLSGKDRPKEFKTEYGKQHFLVVYKREKK